MFRGKSKSLKARPLVWTEELWLAVTGDLSQFHSMLLIEGLEMKADLSAASRSSNLERKYLGRMIAREGSPLKFVRVSLSLHTEQYGIDGGAYPQDQGGGIIPATARGWIHTTNWDTIYKLPPSLSVNIRTDAEGVDAFEEMFIRAKTLAIPYLPVWVWADTLARTPAGENANAFARILVVSRVIFRQNISLTHYLSQEETEYGYLIGVLCT